jgi:hypothetical protein
MPNGFDTTLDGLTIAPDSFVITPDSFDTMG